MNTFHGFATHELIMQDYVTDILAKVDFKQRLHVFQPGPGLFSYSRISQFKGSKQILTKRSELKGIFSIKLNLR